MPRHILAYLVAASLAVAPLAAHSGQSPADDAAAQLIARNVSVDNDSFIQEITAGHSDTVQLFLMAGAHAGTQNKLSVSALSAAIAANADKTILDMLLATLPQGAGALNVLNLQDKEGFTALHRASEKGNTAIVELVIARGADIAPVTKQFATPLMIAAQKNQEAVARLLLAAIAKTPAPLEIVEAEDTKGNKALTYAIQSQSPAIVKLLLEAKADAAKPDTLGVTPLMLAAEGGDEAIAAMLLAAGAKTDATSKSGHTALSIAIRNGHSALVHTLIEKSAADVKLHYPSLLATALEASKPDPALFAFLLERTPPSETLPSSLLFSALDRKNHDAATLLLARNPDIKAVNENNETLLYHAIDSGFEDITLELIKRGAETSHTGASGISPIARAVRHNMAQVVKILLDKGASADQKTPEGYTLAEMCVYSGYPETLTVLLAAGVKIEREFALLWAIRDGKGKAVPVLLEYGAVPNIMNQDGIPAITLAAEAGQKEAIAGFIAHKAQLDYPSKTQNMTALAAAAHAGHVEIVKMLAEAGANLEAADNFGMTPLAHAAVLSKADAVEYLLSKGANPKATDAQKRSISDIAGQAASSPERDRVLQLLAGAAIK